MPVELFCFFLIRMYVWATSLFGTGDRRLITEMLTRNFHRNFSSHRRYLQRTIFFICTFLTFYTQQMTKWRYLWIQRVKEKVRLDPFLTFLSSIHWIWVGHLKLCGFVYGRRRKKLGRSISGTLYINWCWSRDPQLERILFHQWKWDEYHFFHWICMHSQLFHHKLSFAGVKLVPNLFPPSVHGL